MKFLFNFPLCDAETIIMEGATYGEAADKAIAERIKHVSPVKADGEVYDKPSMTNPKGAIINGS
jgi:hypothetical protein